MKFITMMALAVTSVCSAMKSGLIIPFFVLAACAPPQDHPNTPDLIIENAPIRVAKSDVSESNETEDSWVNPYPSYCFERAGQIGADGNQDEPRRGEVCEVHGGGAGGLEAGTGSDPRNTATLHVSSPSLRAIGMKSFSFLLNRKSSDPKFTTGVHIMDQYSTKQMMKKKLTVLPDRLAFGSDLSGETSMFTHTSPDAANLRANAGGIDFTGYEIFSAVLNIDTANDVPLDDFEAEFARKAGMVTGEQYIEGTLTISLIPMGSTGQQFGPTSFEFGTTLEWGYSKSLHTGK